MEKVRIKVWDIVCVWVKFGIKLELKFGIKLGLKFGIKLELKIGIKFVYGLSLG